MIKRISPKDTNKYNMILSADEIKGISERREFGFADVDDEGQVCGIVVLSNALEADGEPAGYLILENYFVRPEYRRQGRFRQMLEYLRTGLQIEANGILAQVILPEMADCEKAFTACGFERINDGNKVITFLVDDLDRSLFASKKITVEQKLLKKYSQLSEDERAWFESSFFEGYFPRDLGPHTLGEALLPEYSFVFYDGEGACAGFLLSSAMPDHTLYLGSMYVMREYSPMAIVMLGALYSKIKADGDVYKKIMTALAYRDSIRLSKHIFKNFKGKIKIQETHNYFIQL
ncbi:MAG: GNAT family N-acetyltransferase [Lachnospiraceae bacterium]|nr:GNAT family N-acetyltransferase [Lachnospiraceae bacterium]